MLNSPMWPVATVLVVQIIEHFIITESSFELALPEHLPDSLEYNCKLVSKRMV